MGWCAVLERHVTQEEEEEQVSSLWNLAASWQLHVAATLMAAVHSPSGYPYALNPQQRRC